MTQLKTRCSLGPGERRSRYSGGRSRMQRSGLARALLACAIALVAALFLTTAAQATTFNVDSHDDTPDASIDGTCDDGTGHCTLRAAIDEANQDTAGADDVINLPVGRYVISLGGTSGAFENANTAGDFDIFDNGSVTINGATSDPRDTVVSGNGNDRVFHVLDGGNLSLSNLTVTDGNSQEDDGGGIQVGGSFDVFKAKAVSAARGTLSISNTRVVNNVAPFGNGGGISTYCDSSLTVTNSHVDRNTAYGSGGGVYSCGDMSATDSTIDGNNAKSSNAGGVYL